MNSSAKIALIAALFAASSGAFAEDTLKKWQFGGGISYWSTIDDIRSNSTTAFAPADPSQAGNLPSIIFTDPRPDANELNQPTIHDDFKLDFNANFGVTRWVTLQLQASYFKGSVGNIEFYSEDRHLPISLNRILIDPTGGFDCSVVTCYQMSGPADPNLKIRNGFVPVGEITEIPLQFSGVVRFRPESPFDPYLGAGIGYIFTKLDTGTEAISSPITLSASTQAGDDKNVVMKNFNDVAAYTNQLQVQTIQSGARAIQTYPCHQVSFHPAVCVPNNDPNAQFLTPLEATVNPAPEWHLMGGFDYYFTSHVALYVDGRYVWARSKVEVRVDGQNQILAGIKDYGCVSGAPTCRTLNGAVVDTSHAVITNDTIDDVKDLILIQGGDIRLGGFSLGFGVRYTF